MTVTLAPGATEVPATYVVGQPVPDQTAGVGARVATVLGTLVGVEVGVMVPVHDPLRVQA